MVTQTTGMVKTFKCSAAVSKHTIAKFGSDDDTLSTATASTESFVGVFLEDTTLAGEDVSVQLDGIVNIKAGGNITRGDRLTSDANGNAIKATNANQTSIGYALASGVSNDIIPCLLIQNATTGASTFSSKIFDICSPASITVSGAATYSSEQILGGYIIRDPNGGARTDVIASAATIINNMPGCVVGASWEFMVKNAADGAETITVTGGTGITINGTATIAQNNTKIFKAVVTNVATPAITIYSVGTLVH